MVVESRHVRGGFAAVIRHRRRCPTTLKAHQLSRVESLLSAAALPISTTENFIEKDMKL